MDLITAMKERHSVRRYTTEPIPLELKSELNGFVEEVNRESGLSIKIRFDDPEGFDSKLAHYGSFRNVWNYIILKGTDCVDFEEKCGYYGEKVVLQAQMMGLNTCWTALTFNKKNVKELVPEGEQFCMVIALGYGETQGTPHKGKSIKDVVATKGQMPDWFKAGVEAAQLAPTAVNQQKFRIGMLGKEPAIKVHGTGFYTKTDLGIVKYHFELASGHKVL